MNGYMGLDSTRRADLRRQAIGSVGCPIEDLQPTRQEKTLMNYRTMIRSAGIAVCIGSAALTDTANSQTAGSFTLATGWLHVAPQGNATPLTVESVGGMTVNQQVPGSGAHATSTDTLG